MKLMFSAMLFLVIQFIMSFLGIIGLQAFVSGGKMMDSFSSIASQLLLYTTVPLLLVALAIRFLPIKALLSLIVYSIFPPTLNVINQARFGGLGGQPVEVWPLIEISLLFFAIVSLSILFACYVSEFIAKKLGEDGATLMEKAEYVLGGTPKAKEPMR